MDAGPGGLWPPAPSTGRGLEGTAKSVHRNDFPDLIFGGHHHVVDLGVDHGAAQGSEVYVDPRSKQRAESLPGAGAVWAACSGAVCGGVGADASPQAAGKGEETAEARGRKPVSCPTTSQQTPQDAEDQKDQNVHGHDGRANGRPGQDRQQDAEPGTADGHHRRADRHRRETSCTRRMADRAGKMTKAEMSREPTRFMASTMTTAMTMARKRL